jgi:hypothetical protein
MIKKHVAQAAGAAFSGLGGQLVAEKAGSGLHEDQAHKAGRGEEQLAPETAFLEDVIHKPAQEEVNPRSGCGGDCQHQGGEQVMPQGCQSVFAGHDRIRVKRRVFRIRFLHLNSPRINSPRTAIDNDLEIQTKIQYTRARGERQLTLQKMAIGDGSMWFWLGSGGFYAGRAAP